MINKKQIANMARITDSQMKLETVDNLIDLITSEIAGKKHSLEYANENQLKQDRAHLRRFDTPHVLFVNNGKKSSVVPLERNQNAIEQMTSVLRAIKFNRDMEVSFNIL